jgi:hypothetical protein
MECFGNQMRHGNPEFRLRLVICPWSSKTAWRAKVNPRARKFPKDVLTSLAAFRRAGTTNRCCTLLYRSFDDRKRDCEGLVSRR